MPKSDSPVPQRQPAKRDITLNDIWSSLNKIQESVSSHDTKLISIVSNIKSLETSLKSFSLVIDKISTELAQVKEEKAALCSEVKLLQAKVMNLEKVSSNGISAPDLFHEVHQRMTKASNLMVFNLPSVADESPEVISRLVDDLFHDLSVEVKYISVKRIGLSGSRPRPIVVELSSPADVRAVLKSKFKLRRLERWNDVWIGEDQTDFQRKQLSSLRSDLKRLRDSGDHGWAIRYFNGSPQLAKKSSNGSPKN